MSRRLLSLKPLANNNPVAVEVHTALQGLVKGIEGQLSKFEKRTQREIPPQRSIAIQSLLEQMQHCLFHLNQQQVSLLAGLKYLQQTVWPAALNCISSGAGEWTAAVQHIFSLLLRLHDGLILCISGECRHEADVQRVRKFKYKSHLGIAIKQENENAETRTTYSHLRSDGYTQLYAASQHRTYSGTSWDEFMDPATGLQERLWLAVRPFGKQQKQKATWWEQLMEGKAMALEQLLTQIETRQTTIQTEFQSMTRKFPVDLQCALQKFYTNVHVQLKFPDKMEQWHVTAGNERLRLERYGREFQIRHVHGVLPPFQKPAEWKDIMELPSSLLDKIKRKLAVDDSPSGNKSAPSKRKRRVIVESDDDEHDDDDEDNHQSETIGTPAATTKDSKQPAASKTVDGSSCSHGLTVKHDKRPAQTKKTNDSPKTLSLAAIKQQMGVDVYGLAQAREFLETEERAAIQAAEAIDEMHVNVDYDNDEEARYQQERNTYEESLLIQQALDRVHSLKRVLKRILRRQQYNYETNTIGGHDNYHYEIWDAREHLRQAAMEAGNRLLWAAIPDDKQHDRVIKSISYFSFANNLVHAQQELHKQMSETTGIMAEDFSFYQRNLLMLSVQAVANTGIAKVELGLLLDARDMKRKMHLREAVQDLEQALATTHTLVSSAHSEDAENGCCGDERTKTLLDVLQAYQLQSLTNRWLGISLWHQGRRKQAMEAFKSAGTFPDLGASFNTTTQVDDLVEAEADLRVEGYYAWTTFADLASQALEQTSVGSLREYAPTFDGIFNDAINALRHGGLASTRIQKLCESLGQSSCPKWETICSEKGILPEKDLTASATELREWWKRKKESAQQVLTFDRNATEQLARNDVVTSGSVLGESAPTQRLVFTEKTRRANRTKLKTGAGYSNIGNTNHNIDEANATHSGRKYRKWGDQLLPQTIDENGKFVPKLSYPSIAPEMPPEIQALLQEWKQQSRN